MTSASNITGIQAGAQAAAPAALPASSTANSATEKPLSPVATASLSPRIVFDPSAGTIIQYLNNGQVESQIPSSTVVAYLRAGLTAQGYPRSQSTQA